MAPNNDLQNSLHSGSPRNPTNDTAGFLVKVAVASALLSLLLKYGGRLLPIAAPYTSRLNGLVTAIILLPSLAVGLGLLWLLKAQRSSNL